MPLDPTNPVPHVNPIDRALSAYLDAAEGLRDAYNSGASARVEKARGFAARVESEWKSLKSWAYAASGLTLGLVAVGIVFPSSFVLFATLGAFGVFPVWKNMRDARAKEPAVKVWRRVVADAKDEQDEQEIQPFDFERVLGALKRDAETFPDPTWLWGRSVVDAVRTAAARASRLTEAIGRVPEPDIVDVRASAQHLELLKSLAGHGNDTFDEAAVTARVASSGRLSGASELTQYTRERRGPTLT